MLKQTRSGRRDVGLAWQVCRGRDLHQAMCPYASLEAQAYVYTYVPTAKPIVTTDITVAARNITVFRPATGSHPPHIAPSHPQPWRKTRAPSFRRSETTHSTPKAVPNTFRTGRQTSRLCRLRLFPLRRQNRKVRSRSRPLHPSRQRLSTAEIQQRSRPMLRESGLAPTEPTQRAR